ncbi:spermidine/putrescine transport system substrate-binding protein [Allocatelliglobosispora scoriae]|uniref:Spermidine/putrescine transport system substrate-binding protein n=1 Tax=Allocatelliglobosispora scoriae TaxID=643052 RepID=A0A841BRD9_9ACTN|nr:spermidine/putrescine ABC transporter substrate-binding protein [Allocatelliglobosispora scoriae]MBB5870265.1 spermidine/putrescine transport system substrate-binding protein [Allocatelliglobosispora scoriae]
MPSRSRTPLSPEARAILAASGGTSRRNLMRGAVAGGALVAAGASLAGCGTKPTKSPGASAGPACATPDVSAADRKLVFSNWVEYMDTDEKDEKKHPTLDAFAAKTGIAVTYQEDVNDNNEFLGKVRTQLNACQTIDRDIVVFTDWMAGKFIKLGFAQKFDPSKVATFQKNLLPTLKGRSFDSEQLYAAPWTSGTTGIGYNAKFAKEVRNIDELLTRADLKGKVSVLKELNDTMGLLLLSLGKDPDNFTEADFDAALDKLKKAVDSGQIRRAAGNDYLEDLAKGDVVAAIGWSGDVIGLSGENENIKFVTPDEGLMRWSDNMLIPVTSGRASNAMALIDYYYDPKIAAELAAYINYICPVVGAQEAMKDIDPELVENQAIFPTAETLGKTKVFKELTEAERKNYEAKFQAVIGA